MTITLYDLIDRVAYAGLVGSHNKSSHRRGMLHFTVLTSHMASNRENPQIETEEAAKPDHRKIESQYG